MINKIDLRKAISSIAISNAKRNTIYRAFSDLDSITKEEFDSVKSDISKVVESMLTKDTVGKANGVASLDSNGSVPIEQLGNIDTTLFLIVRELPTTDIQSNKIYLVPNQNGQGDNVYFEYLYVVDAWEKLGEFKPEVDLSYIEAKLETKANITDVDNRLDDLQNYCFKLGYRGGISAPFSLIYRFGQKIQLLNNDEVYTYGDISSTLEEDTEQYIYDKTINSFIKTTKTEYLNCDPQGDFFKTIEPLDLTHTFYLDNEKTGIVENLTRLTIEESNVFVNLPYVEVNDNLDDDTSPQYIYDATDNKWIEVVDTYYVEGCYAFNTEKPLDLTHELYYSYSSAVVNWTTVGDFAIALGDGSSANGHNSTSLGCGTSANGDNSTSLGNNTSANVFASIAIGNSTKSEGECSIAMGDVTFARGGSSIAIGKKASTDTQASESIAIGANTSVFGNNSLALGSSISINASSAIAIGNSTEAHNSSMAIGSNAKAKSEHSLALGASSNTGGNYAIALGKNVSNTKSIFGVGFDGVNGIDMDRDNYGLYLKDFGGYDGTNLVVKSGDTETLNPDIKSVQQIINEKADTSAIPAKLSDLENDKVNITTSKDDTSYSFKIDYKDGDVLRSTLGYKPYGNNNTNIAEFGLYSYDTTGNRLSQIRMRPENNKDDSQYLIQVQDVKEDKVNKMSSITTTGFDNQNYENGTAVLLESEHLEFYVISNGFQKQLTVNKDGITKKDGKATEVFAANGTLFDLTTKADASTIPTKVSQLTNDSNFITSYTETDPVWTSEKTNYYTKTEIDGKGYLTAHQSLDDCAKQTDIDNLKADMSDYVDDSLENYVNIQMLNIIASGKADLVDDKLKAEQLPKLFNITTAATIEEVVTKFNALLADLKAKGYMKADTAK